MNKTEKQLKVLQQETDLKVLEQILIFLSEEVKRYDKEGIELSELLCTAKICLDINRFLAGFLKLYECPTPFATWLQKNEKIDPRVRVPLLSTLPTNYKAIKEKQ